MADGPVESTVSILNTIRSLLELISNNKNNIALWLLLAAVALFVLSIFFEPLNNILGPKRIYIESQESLLRKKLHPEDESAIDLWDKLVNSRNAKIKDRNFLSNNILDAIQSLEGRVNSDFEERFQVYYYYTLSYYYKIDADINRRVQSIYSGYHYIEIIDKIITSNQSDDSFSNYIKNENLRAKLNWLKFNLLVFQTDISGDEDLKNRVQTELEEFGGCDKLLEEQVYHVTIYKITGCQNLTLEDTSNNS